MHLILAYDPPAMTYSNATHACAVEIDRETGTPQILRYLLVEDASTVINPLISAGQAHGAVMNAISDALAQVGARLTEQPASAPRIWQALRQALSALSNA